MRRDGAMSFITFSSIRKVYGAANPVVAVENLDLGIEAGEFMTLLGPSGSGKTTTLMMLAGFEQPTSGTIALDGQRIETLPAYARNMGVVFQGYSLFPHMTVAQNVAFPLEMRKLPKTELRQRVTAALEKVRLARHADRRPSQLSGGEQQRVALARAQACADGRAAFGPGQEPARRASAGNPQASPRVGLDHGLCDA
jgi:putative spermidine/putrescine transport system ATP-binding protein